MTRRTRGVAIVAAAALSIAAYVSASYILDPAVQDSGGGHAESASYQADVSIGGPVIVTGAASGQTASSPGYTCEVGGIAVIEAGRAAGPSPGGGGGCVGAGSGASAAALLLPLGMLVFLKRRRGTGRV